MTMQHLMPDFIAHPVFGIGALTPRLRRTLVSYALEPNGRLPVTLAQNAHFSQPQDVPNNGAKHA
jgi:hypothetical protein